MAKIEFSALVNRIKGRISFSVISNWKGIAIIKRHNGSPRQPRTEKQQDIRGYFSDIAGEFYALTETQTDLWNAYASMLPGSLTALNAFMKHNMILQKYFPETARMTAPPKTPDTPPHGKSLSVSALAAADFCIEWVAPTLTTVYMITDYWAMPGRDSITNPRWTFGASAGADTTELLIATTLPTDTVVKFRCRTVDAFGRVSPWSHVLQATAL